MRTQVQIDSIKKNFSDPFVVENFINNDELSTLIEIFESSKKNLPVVYKNTGPETLDLNFIDHPIKQVIFERLKKYIGPFEITAAFFFKTRFPHIIHNDDTFELPSTVYKGITLPLDLDGPNNCYPKLCFFNQHYFHGPAKFFNGSEHIPTYYNKQIYNYIDVDGLAKDPIDSSTINQYYTHLKKNWLEGLSHWGVLEWVPGNAIIFDSVRLHCASDFRQQKIKSKLGISIFTKKSSECAEDSKLL